MKHLIIISISLLVTGCGPLRMFFHGPNYTDQEGMRQGKWLFTSVQDPEKIESKGRFKDDRPAGKWKYYDDDENLLRKEKYKNRNGEICIKTIFYYPSGEIEKEGWARVEHSEIQTHYYWTGNWKYYSEAGELLAVKQFRKGLAEPEVLWEHDTTSISSERRQ